jgi:tRNA pseudouridine55 synthase
VGDATRSIEYLAAAAKSYLAEVTLGVTTDSYDGDGQLIATADPGGISRDQVELALDAFRGEIAQVPPMYSAIQVGGRRLHELARAGVEVERAARTVTIHHLALIDWSPPVCSLFVDCSKGTYVRSLAHDLGARLGVGAFLSHLVRVRTGPFTLCDAVRLDELPGLLEHEPWEQIAIHPDVALQDRRVAVIGAPNRERWGHGIAMPIAGAAGELLRVYDDAGTWLGVGQIDPEGAFLRPLKVIATS